MDQNAQPKKFYQQKWFLISIVVFIVLVIIGKLTPNQNTGNSVNSSSSTPKSAKDAIKITAIDLMKEYDQNEVAADQKYKNKIIQITGVIDTIGKLPPFDDPYVGLLGKPKDEYSISNVQCLFDNSDEKQLTTLKKGDLITLVGTGNGKLVLDVKLKNCQVLK